MHSLPWHHRAHKAAGRKGGKAAAKA